MKNEKIDIFIEKLLKWNKIHNLTGATTKEEILENIKDSIYPIRFLPPIKNCLDIGSGAGFPGLILAIFMQKSKFVLVEPRVKRAAFLNYIVSTLDLKNVVVKNIRVEEIEPKKFELITSRAVAKTSSLLKLSKPFTTKDTILLLYKGEEVEKEIKDIKNLKYEIIKREKRRYLLIKGFK